MKYLTIKKDNKYVALIYLENTSCENYTIIQLENILFNKFYGTNWKLTDRLPRNHNNIKQYTFKRLKINNNLYGIILVDKE